jgi:hypothetical protein
MQGVKPVCGRAKAKRPGGGSAAGRYPRTGTGVWCVSGEAGSESVVPWSGGGVVGRRLAGQQGEASTTCPLPARACGGGFSFRRSAFSRASAWR